MFSRSIFPLLPPYSHDPHGSQFRHPDDLTPYLGLRARLSQVWINRWTILLLLVLVRVLIAVTGMETDMDKAHADALRACTTVESMGSSMASMPHYMAQGVNEVTASSVEHAVHALQSVLMLSLTAVEELVLFFIKVMYQTYLCLFTLAVRGSVQVAVGVIKDATEFLNSTVKEIGHDISKTVDTFESGLNKFLDGINSVASAFGGDVPKLDVGGSLDKLDHLSLPSSIDTGLDKLNDSIPTFSEVDAFVSNVLRTPFELVKKRVNESLTNYTFDRAALSVPTKAHLSFCADHNGGINAFFDDISDLAALARRVFIAVLVILAVLVCLFIAWQEIRRWRTMKDRSHHLLHKDPSSSSTDPMDAVYIISRPVTAALGIQAASRCSTSRRQNLTRWAVAYATTPAALFMLTLGLAGLLACLGQYILLHAVQRAVPDLATQVGAFADQVVTHLDDTSKAWAHDANAAIADTDASLNEDLLDWVDPATTALNDTLNAFVDKTESLLNDTFGDTLLRDLLDDLFDCLIGLKIDAVQKGLTWVHDNAHINLPDLPSDIFTRGAADSINGEGEGSFLSDAGDQTANKITEVVARVVAKIDAAIRFEAIIFSILVLLWALNALVGILRALSLFWTRDKTRGEGGPAPALRVHVPPPPHSHHSSPNSSGFIDVPLTAMPNPASYGGRQHDVNNGGGDADDDISRTQPAPRYEVATAGQTRVNMPAVSEAQYQDEKLGFAGQRPLMVDGGPDLRGSSYVEYAGEKR
ncbi:pheromone-regulated protein PRM1 [Aspergillus candidus]|uniref:Plasma membrane fusion protein PRM1 n=1 Tax=Aspergillus candidus TaxID=41067 RepID=A0A2I2F3E6_ASPCN|nr:plasma membrane fusion protein Prm1 [Aspergillus candidus]PLB35108.1 plasma membrane fusion protein Prm1 [Aspergillus candidus]